jgi:hypothetical protein
MMHRFVTIPAVPKETSTWRSGVRFYCTTTTAGFNIYDNEDKRRLEFWCLTRAEADEECERLNSGCFQSMFIENSTSSSP